MRIRSDDDIDGRLFQGEVAAGAEGAELISFGSSLAQVRGHHLVSLELYGNGDIQGASTHAGHPVAELLSGIASELEEHDGAEVADELTAVLNEGPAAIGENVTPAELGAIYDEAAAVTDEAAAVDRRRRRDVRVLPRVRDRGPVVDGCS